MSRVVAPLLFGLIGAGILVWLGVWQMQRLDWKEGVLTQIEERIAGPALPLPVTPDPERDLYQPVNLTGNIDTGELHVLVSVKLKGAGYRVIAPLTTEGGRRVLLDRGYVPTTAKATMRPLGPTQVIGNLNWPDDRNSSTPENDIAGNIWFARDLQEMAAELNTEPLLVIARAETPPAPGIMPIPVNTDGIPNDHLQYAITWFSLAIVWLVMTGYFIWRQRTV